MAVPYVTTPVDEMAWSIPTDADELCMMAVSTSPIKIPSNGLLKDVNRFWKLSDSLSGANTPSMVFIPRKRIPRPTRILAISRFLLLFVNSMINAPIHIRIGANDDGFKSLRRILVSARSPRRRICAVAVLPMLAPNTTGIACPSFMMPAFTKPMSMMVVAAEL